MDKFLKSLSHKMWLVMKMKVKFIEYYQIYKMYKAYLISLHIVISLFTRQNMLVVKPDWGFENPNTQSHVLSEMLLWKSHITT